VALDDQSFGPSLLEPSALERPFFVLGVVSDEELVSLVDFIRGSPLEFRESSRSADDVPVPGERVNGRYPITAVTRDSEDTFEVGTEEREGRGRYIKVRREGSRWLLVEVSEVMV